MDQEEHPHLWNQVTIFTTCQQLGAVFSCMYLFIEHIRPEKKSIVSGFPTNTMKLGPTASFSYAIAWKSKEKHTFQWKCHENRIKNNKVMTFFVSPNVIVWLVFQSCRKYCLLYFLKQLNSYQIKIKKKKKKLFWPTDPLPNWGWNRKQGYLSRLMTKPTK